MKNKGLCGYQENILQDLLTDIKQSDKVKQKEEEKLDDFLYILKQQLEGRLSDEQITDQMHIYEDYIQEQLAGGKTMEQVMRKLGDPEKVADMIVEHYEKLERQQQRENIGSMTADEINANVQNPEHGFHAEFIENEGWDVRIGKLKLNTWYGTLIILGAVLGISILISEIMH